MATSETMPDSADRPTPRTFRAALRRLLRRPPEQLLSGGVYGAVLASGLAAALDQADTPPDPGHDALWVLISAVAAAVAHGYAHAVAHHAATEETTTQTLRSVLGEWPLVAATLPTMGALLGAFAGWWNAYTGVNVVLVVNAVVLFCLGAWASRVSGGTWGVACRVGGVYMLLGLMIIVANTFIE
ncbi:hypothetical protein FHS43_001713 [Streptosporangium becharense]|nr:hypothetical protein [Streptosporangium becharense]